MLARPFLPSLDLIGSDAARLRELSDDDKRRVLTTKIADVTHFRVGLATLHQHASVALDMAAEVRTLPRQVRGLVLQPDRGPAERVSVQPALPGGGAVIGRGVVTDALGLFTLPLPNVSDAQRRRLLAGGLDLLVTGTAGPPQRITVPVPPTGAQAIGEIVLEDALEPMPASIVGALIDLVDDLPAGTNSPGSGAGAHEPVKVQVGQDACSITFEEDAVVRRFPYKVLVRLVEPRTTTVTRVFFPSGPFFENAGRAARFMVPAWDANLISALQLTDTRFVERVPVDKPISVDGFRDQIIGVRNNTIGTERAVPMAGTLGLGYVLNLAQVWKYDGLTLGNLLYSLPLAPGEQQRIVVSERVATASVSELERVDIAEQQHSALRENASAQATFDSAFEEHVSANSSYRNEARSSSWGVAGGIGAVLGPVAIGIGAGGGGGKSSNNGSTQSSLDGARTYTSSTAEDMHRSVERQASGRRSSQRTAIRLATETDRESITTKVITNHNKAHALTIQYWEVLRKFQGTTAVEGVSLVCFVPLDLVRFLPPGQQLELTETVRVDTREELLVRYALLHRHADAVQPNLPGRLREGLRLLEDFAANIRVQVDVVGPAADVLAFSLTGRYIPYERLWVQVLVRGGRRIGPVRLDSPLTAIAPGSFGTRAEFFGELKRLRREGGEVAMTGSIVIPESIDKSEVIGFDIRRAFDVVDYQLDPTKNSLFDLIKNSTAGFPGLAFNLGTLEASVRIETSELERELGGPNVRAFKATINNAADSIAADDLGSAVELPSGGLPVAALERNPVLGFRDMMKIERTLQHVVRNTLTYSKAVWSSLTAEERVVMLEGYTIGLPEEGLDPDGFTDASQHVPLLNCVANQVLGYYGNCMIMPFSIPASLAVRLAGDVDAEGAEDRAPLTNSAVQEALTRFHTEAFSPPVSHFTLPTRGVLGEAVLGHCPSAEKIDLTRFWNWQDSPGDEATAINNVALRANSLAQLTAPATLSNVPSIINNVAGEGGGGLTLGALASTLAGKAPTQQDFSTDFLGQAVLTALGGKTIDSAEAARKDALGSATQLAGKALDAGVDVFKTKFGADKAAADKKDAEKKEAAEKTKAAEKAKADKQTAALKDLKDNAAAYLGAANNKPDFDQAKAFADGIIAGLSGLTGDEKLPASQAAKLFDAYDKKKADDPTDRTLGSKAWLAALGLV
ncbi:hypothetical protein [Methylibium sp.]|uniref:hypothetical protein n=1 Tax=Methylibium sp. TaxID=2067992 RepID=UPI0025DC9594|nr:hypothetical protein [Methylibium sp.]